MVLGFTERPSRHSRKVRELLRLEPVKPFRQISRRRRGRVLDLVAKFEIPGRRSGVDRDNDFVAEPRRQLPGEELLVIPCDHSTGESSFHADTKGLENKHQLPKTLHKMQSTIRCTIAFAARLRPLGRQTVRPLELQNFRTLEL